MQMLLMLVEYTRSLVQKQGMFLSFSRLRMSSDLPADARYERNMKRPVFLVITRHIIRETEFERSEEVEDTVYMSIEICCKFEAQYFQCRCGLQQL